MDMTGAIGKGPAEEPDSGFNDEDVFNLLTEIIAGADILGLDEDGKVVYLVRLSPKSSDALAAMFAAMEDGDELDAGELDPLDEGELDELDRGEDEHDGREPDPEDVR